MVVCPRVGEWDCGNAEPDGSQIQSRFTFNLKESATSYESVGTGWCIDDTKTDVQRHLPVLNEEYQRDANPWELMALCDKYQDCVAVDWAWEREDIANGYLRFSSATALNAVNEPGWNKWSDGCKEGCMVTTVHNDPGDVDPGEDASEIFC